MSRTDKTAPWDVKIFYYPGWLEEFHDHRDGECDLPPKPRNCKDPGHEFWRWNRGHCYWVASYTQFWNNSMSNCPCSMCHGYWMWEDDRSPRAQRRIARRYCRDGWRDEY